MKNIRVTMKLMISFGIVLALAIAIGVLGIFGLTSMSNASNELYSAASPLYDMAVAMEEFQRIRTYTTEIIVFTGNAETLDALEAELHEAYERFGSSMEVYKKSLRTVETEQIWNELMYDFDSIIKPNTESVLASAKLGVGTLALRESMNETEAVSDFVASQLLNLINARDEYMETTNQDNVQLGSRLLIVIIAVFALAVIVSVFLAVYVSGLISKPISALAGFMKKAGSTGDITLSPVDVEVIGKFAQGKDEIGQCIGNTAAFVQHVTGIAGDLKSVAEGDLSIDVKTLSDDDVMGQALKHTIENLNRMFGEINSSSVQVTIGSKQVADGAQSLAQGSTEQAASLEELSSSIAEIASKTKSNASMAEKAAMLAQTIKSNAEKGSLHMDEMITAVNEINEASSSIGKVIKVIDDIAFQTNILALNAAVEAARAGQHGKGFAVVAEEVRNLAAKSAEAAKDTGSLIENSIEKATLGVRIAGETANSLVEIVSGINESNSIVGEIAVSSEQQSAGIDQINIGIDQVAQVVQQNSATAEESAAASEEMSSQSTLLQELISQFKIKEARRGLSAPGARRQRMTEPQETAYIPENLGAYGKY